MWSARRLSITTTTTFMAPAGACARRAGGAPVASSLSQALAPRTVSPTAPAPPARMRSRRVMSGATLCPLTSALVYVDAADRVLVGQLREHLAGDLENVALVVAE